MNQYLYVLRPVREDLTSSMSADERTLVEAHFAYLCGLKDRGSLILAGRTQEAEPFGLVIFEAPDDAHAEKVMAADPSVSGGVFRAHLHPYRVALSAQR